MSINPLTFGSPVYSPPFSVSSGDIDVMKLRSKETAPLSHESLDENFTNLANKINQILGLNIDEVTISSAGVISAANLGISAGSGITYSSSTGVIGHQARPAAQSGWSTGALSNVSRRYVSGLDFDSFGHVKGFRYAQLNFTGSGSVSVNQSSANQVTISSSAYTSGSSPSFGNISGNKLTIGSGVELRESVDRADLLEIRGLTSGWAGIQIKNNTTEHLFSLMSDGSQFGLYDDQQNEWAWEYNENGGHTFRHNNAVKLATSTTGVSVTGTCTATAFSGDGANVTNVVAKQCNVTESNSGSNNYQLVWRSGSTLYSSNWFYINRNNKTIYATYFSGDGSNITNVNAQTLDGINGASLVRSDANDTVTGLLTLSRSGENLRLRGSASTSSPYVSFYQQDTRRAYIQFADSTNTLNLFNDVYDDYLKIGSGSSGLKWNYSGTDYTVYHSGNLPSIPSVSSASQKIQDVTGDYGSVKVTATKGSYNGYALSDDWVLMSNGAGLCGIYNDTNNEWATIWRQNAETELMHNGVVKLETTSGGATVTGTLTASTIRGTSNIRANDNVEIIMGTDNDFQMYHNGAHQYCRSFKHGGNIYFQGESTSGILRGLVYMMSDSAYPYVKMYYNGNEKFRTTNTGIQVSGNVTFAGEEPKINITDENIGNYALTDQMGSGNLTYDSGFNVSGAFTNSQNEFKYVYVKQGKLVTLGFYFSFDNDVTFSNGYSNAKWKNLPFASSTDSNRFAHGFGYCNDNPRKPFALTLWGNKLWLMATEPTTCGYIYGQITYKTV